MTTFTTSESGMFSAANYVESAQTLTVTFRTGGATYAIKGVDPSLAARFMKEKGKSAIYHGELKGKEIVRL